MRAILFFALVVASFNKIEGGYYGNCKIVGISDSHWLFGFTTENSIGDTHEGLIVTYQTRNIVEMISYESTYMSATFSEDTLSIFTNERFKKFEEENQGSSWYTPTIEMKIKFNCTDNETDTLKLEQEVTDDNTHDPIFNKDIYEYHFGMSVPEDYDFAQFQSISATDKDFTNAVIYYTMEYSEDLLLGYEGDDYYDGKNYITSLKTLRELKAPFRKEFTVVARDGGKPSRNSTARIIVTVASNGNGGDESNESGQDGEDSDEENETGSHPPVFAKHLYFANYTSQHDLEMKEPITIKYGAEDDTTIRQSGYDEYFKITLNRKIKGVVDVINLQSLPETIMESTSFLVIEIEAENKDLHMPGRTALIINLPTTNLENSNCSTAEIWGFPYNNTVSLVFFLTAIFMIVVMNIVVLIWFFQKKKMMTEVVNVPYPISPIDDIPRLEKVRI